MSNQNVETNRSQLENSKVNVLPQKRQTKNADTEPKTGEQTKVQKVPKKASKPEDVRLPSEPVMPQVKE